MSGKRLVVVVAFDEDDQGREAHELRTGHPDTLFAEEQIVLDRVQPLLSEEDDRIGGARVAELQERALWPAPPRKRELGRKRVVALGGQWLERLGPALVEDREPRAVETPAVVDVVLGQADLRDTALTPRASVRVERDQRALGHPLRLSRERLGRPVQTARRQRNAQLSAAGGAAPPPRDPGPSGSSGGALPPSSLNSTPAIVPSGSSRAQAMRALRIM